MIRFKKIPKNIYKQISLLPDFFRRDPDIVFAYLFGGLARDKKGSLSDVDLAIYVTDPKSLNFLSLLGKISQILGTDEIDMVVLNSAPISLSGRILRNKKLLVDKDPFLRHRYESRTLREFFDFTLRERQILHRRYGLGR